MVILLVGLFCVSLSWIYR